MIFSGSASLFLLCVFEFGMLALSPLASSKDDQREEREMEGFSIEIEDFSPETLFEDIDFDDLFAGDILPDLEMDPEMLAEFSVSGGEESEMNLSVERAENEKRDLEEAKCSSQSDEFVSKRDESETMNSPPSDGDRGRKPKVHLKGSQGKRKVKVDWTPELHRRFVQAVEQLGVDKAVPSRILELMGIDCLTRHNIASHLQKYRSHRKHLLAREAEAASWSQRRQIYSGCKREVSPWLAPTMGFPPPPAIPPYRPLHVWGHPTIDPSLMHVWPKHLVHAPSPPPQRWAPPPPRPDTSYWHHQRGSKDGWAPNSLTQGTPCFPQPLTPTRFSAPPVPGIPPHALYKADNTIPVLSSQFEFHPSKETVDAAIGDVLAKPWLPLPLGLKPPSMDGVLVELQRQGISTIPPNSS
eukprot:TRINITY_DN630_c0_g3_i1.p1 TRINITY_DN630_c0_g3~~TRINITY_DN630_c0_g3_i1.p1  ORF type:complete len:411 (-),score=84.23 TRINITY_DN630_c0_g3_i1:160-1392(-)